MTARSINALNPSAQSDWEGLAWDPRTKNLLVGYSRPGFPVIYEVTYGNPVVLQNTDQRRRDHRSGTYRRAWGSPLPATTQTKSSLWVTDRETSKIFEISFDGTTPPSTTSTSTTQQTTTTTQATTTTTAVPQQPPLLAPPPRPRPQRPQPQAGPPPRRPAGRPPPPPVGLPRRRWGPPPQPCRHHHHNDAARWRRGWRWVEPVHR